MKGFFSTSVLMQSKAVVPRIAQCGSCKLNKKCRSPKMQYSGKGRKKVLIISEFPGKEEDRQGRHLVGEAGLLFRKILTKMNIDLNQDCWVTSAIACCPSKNTTPTADQIQACSPILFKTINDLSPNVIILLGGVSVQAVVGVLRKEAIRQRGAFMSWQIPSQQLNAWICPTYDPSYLVRMQNSLIERALQHDLTRAFALADTKPWTKVPDYTNDVEVITKPSLAATVLKEFTEQQGTIAFDYEANCLKPEYEGSEIYSCSVCSNGKRTIAYPWAGAAIDATAALLKSPVEKIASNLKFEDRWTKNKLNIRISNWKWDTMIAAHALDNRKGITSLKFQSFVLLGQPCYNAHIEPLLESEDSSHINRIHEIDMRDLLLYNGLDSLLEYKVAQIQRRKYKHDSCKKGSAHG